MSRSFGGGAFGAWGGLIVAGALVLAACDATPEPGEGPSSRTNGTTFTAPKGALAAAFCDLRANERQAASFHWPELAAGSRPPPVPTTWRWVTVWATWCKPCIEEMPRIAAWKARLAAAGHHVEIAFVSVDDSEADVEAFRQAHPETPPSIRIAGAPQRAAWLKAFGLDDGAIPIQLFVSPNNRLRCARAGGIRDKDYPAVEQLLSE